MAEKIQLVDKQKLRIFGNEYKKILVKNLIRANKKASGKLIQSIDYRIREEANEINIELLSENYLKFVDKGRRPGSYPPIRPLLEWVKIKNLPERYAWGAQQNIFKFGIKPTNVIQKTIKELETSERLKRLLEEEVLENFINYINELNLE